MKTIKFTKLHQNQGVALLSVLLFFMVMVIMIGSLTILTHGNLRNSTVPTYTTAAYYAAEAGINVVVNDFQEALDISSSSNVSVEDFNARLVAFETENHTLLINLSDNKNKDTSATVTFERLSEDEGIISFMIVSIGKVGDKYRRLEKEIGVAYASGSGDNQGFAVKHAILVEDSLSLGNNVSIALSPEEIAKLEAQGKEPKTWVATTSQDASAVNVNSLFTGNIELLPETPNNVVGDLGQGTIYKTLEVDPFPTIDFNPIRDQAAIAVAHSSSLPNDGSLAGLVSGTNINTSSAGTYVIPESATFLPETSVSTYYIPEMIFDVSGVTIHSDHDVIIATDKLHFLQPVSFTGTGEVSIYVSRNLNTNNVVVPTTVTDMQFKLPTVNNPPIALGRIDNPHLLVVYVDEMILIDKNKMIETTITSSNGLIVGGSFMFYNASINLSNNSSFAGYLITGGININISNNGEIMTTLYYAPNANVTLNNNSAIKGAVISKSFDSGNSTGTQVIYDTTFTDKYPFPTVISPIVGDSDDEGIQTLVFTIGKTIEH